MISTKHYKAILHRYEQRLVQQQELLITRFHNDLLYISSEILDKIQTRTPFYRFQFALGKQNDLLLVACYGDDPALTKTKTITSQDLTTDVYSVRENYERYLQLFLTLQPNWIAHIDDIQIADMHVNKGYGSAAWILTESVLKKFHYHNVIGWLLPTDRDHRNRQVYFYQKLGFTVALKNDEGSIQKSLDMSS